MNATLLQLMNQSVRVQSTAVSIVADALGEALQLISNQVPDWISHPTARPSDIEGPVDEALAVSTSLRAAVVVGVVVGVGAFNIWRYTREVQRMVERRAELARDIPRPAPIEQRRNAVLELPLPPQLADLTELQRDNFFALGSRVGYYQAASREQGDLPGNDPSWHEELEFMEVRYGGVALEQARGCYQAGYHVGEEAARHWMSTSTLSTGP